MKKKQLLFLTLIALCATSAWAYDFSAVAPSGQTLYFNIVNGEAQVTGQNAQPPVYSTMPTGALTIPDSVTNGDISYAVTSIGDLALFGCTGLTSVIIPAGVTAIGDFSFFHCSSLASVVFPDGLTTIGVRSFAGCTGLTTVALPDAVTSIGDGAFEFCSGLTTLAIPNGLTSISAQVFFECGSLVSVVIPDGVTSIGNSAFYGCESLTSVVIPDGVTVIGNAAFYGCYGLTSVSIGNGVTSIGDQAFCGCGGLSNVTIPDGVDTIGSFAFMDVHHIEYHGTATDSPWGAFSMNGVTDGDFVFTDNTKHYLLAYLGLGGDVAIPSTVDTIGNFAFVYCSGLASVIIPDGVSYIGNYAFLGCSGLTTVTIPAGVTHIGEYAFWDCYGLSVITSEALAAPTLGFGVFETVPATVSVHIPCGSLLSYSSEWSVFSNFIEAGTYSLNIQSADSLMGSVVVLTAPTCQAPQAVINAAPNNGYRFDHWSDGSITNPRGLTLSSDTSLVAYFSIATNDTVYVHDTTYITLTDTVTNTVYDTVINTVYDTVDNYIYDTVTIMQYDTVTNMVYDTVDNYIYDTVTVTDTLWLTRIDTLWLHDTVTVHDTVYVTGEGIDGTEALNAKVYSSHGQVVVEGADGHAVALYDVNGRLLARKEESGERSVFDVTSSGTYMIKIGHYPARKVVVVR